MSQVYYPRLSSLITEDDFPDSLSFLYSSFSTFLGKFYFRNLQVQHGSNGVAKSIYLELISKEELSFEVPAVEGLKFGINLDNYQSSTVGSADTGVSVFPISIEYDWPVKAFLKNFDLTNFDADAENYLNLLKDLFFIEKTEMVQQVLDSFIDSETPVKQFAIDYNAKYGDVPISEAYPSANPENDIDSLIADIEDQSTPDEPNVYKAIYKIYLEDTVNGFSSTLDNIDQLLTSKLGRRPVGVILEFIAPFISASTTVKLTLEFPRNILLPMHQVSGEYVVEEDETKKVRLDFAEAELYFDTKGTLGFDGEVSASMAAPYDKAQIGKTGFSLSLTGAKVDLSDTRNIPEAIADGRSDAFKGVFIKNISIGFPDEWKLSDGSSPPEISGEDVLVGSEGGLSGKFTLGAVGNGSVLDFDLFGTTVTLESFSLTMSQNQVVGSEINGTIRLDDLKDSSGNVAILNVKVEFSGDGYLIEFSEPEGIPLVLKGFVKITLYKLTLGKNDGKFFLELKTDAQREFKIPFVDKVLPIGVLLDTLRFEQGEKTTASVYPRWAEDGPVPVTFTDNGVKIKIDVNKEFFKILRVNHIDIGVETITDGIDAELLFNGSLKVGPITATAGGLGLSTEIVKVGKGNGNIGPFGVDASFVPPSEIGLSIKTKAVSGGGYLWLDRDSGNYSGALELSFKDKIDLKAIGILTTKLPGGQKGFSLLIIVTAKFTPIQLGFGFTLNGVGGLLGLHRSVDKEELKLGVRDNRLDNILFPENVVENASTIISDMQSVFPIKKGQFVVGPMGLIGWGAPISILDAELGVILEVPDPVTIAIVGVVKVALPDKDAPIALLQINFAGIIDFENKMFSFDASLFNSRILTFALTGDMALRITWGDKPDFGFAIGGFHPDYEAPAHLAFPEMKRLSISLFDTSYLRVKFETYFAVTSNTVQNGAKLDAWAGSGKFYAEAIFYYNVLLQFNPFRLTAELGAMVGIKMGKKTILSASANVHLEGPKPWELNGEIEFRFLGVGCSLPFNATIGEKEPEKQIASIDAWSKLQSALEHRSNWQAIQPEGNSQLVSLKDEGAENSALIVHPFGSLAFKQSVVPFELELEKFGNGKPKEYKKYEIESVEDGDSNTYTTTDVNEFFAPAEFIKMSDSDKLARDSFQKFVGGAQLSDTDASKTDHFTRKEIGYERKIVDDPDAQTDWAMPEAAFKWEIQLSAVAVSLNSVTFNALPSDAPIAVSVEDPKFKVKSIATLSDHTSLEFDNEWLAMQYIKEQENQNPALEQTLTVLSTLEE